MKSKPGLEVMVSVRCATVADPPGGLASLACLHCRKHLDVHQPDADLSDRMLATCAACKGWHLVECDPSRAEVLVVLLPGSSVFRDLPHP